MKFEETGYIEINLSHTTFIYFLVHNDEVVYIGQTKQGLKRPFSHTDKIFDKLYVIDLPDEINENELTLIEDYYIDKYKPKYNKLINSYYSLIQTRNIFRKMFNNLENCTVRDIRNISNIININIVNNKINIKDILLICRYLQEV